MRTFEFTDDVVAKWFAARLNQLNIRYVLRHMRTTNLVKIYADLARGKRRIL